MKTLNISYLNFNGKTILQEDVGKLQDVSTCMTYAEQSLIKR